jgi:hypothetical protein
LSFTDFSQIKEVSLKQEEISKFNVGDNITLDVLDGIQEVEIT